MQTGLKMIIAESCITESTPAKTCLQLQQDPIQNSFDLCWATQRRLKWTMYNSKNFLHLVPWSFIFITPEVKFTCTIIDRKNAPIPRLWPPTHKALRLPTLAWNQADVELTQLTAMHRCLGGCRGGGSVYDVGSIDFFFFFWVWK